MYTCFKQDLQATTKSTNRWHDDVLESDGSLLPNTGYAGLGYALGDRKGKVLAAGCSLCFATNPKQAQGLAFFEGVQEHLSMF